jgi:organic hydroperoxide reductase OsmC/OhrA
LCADAGVIVVAYDDNAEGTMIDSAEAGRFARIVLRPRVTIGAQSDRALAEHLHHTAHERCYIANSVNFPIACEPTIEVAAA